MESGHEATGPRRRGRSGETRARLREVCLAIVRSDGQSALSVHRVAQEAGISPPGFYNHFKNTEQLLAESLEPLLLELARRQSIGDALKRLNISSSLPGPQLGREVLDGMLSVFLEQPRIAELYLRYRADPTMIGGAVTRVAEQVRDETIDTIWTYTKRTGVQPRGYPRVAIFGEHLLALYYGAAEMLLADRHDREAVVAATAQAIFTLTLQLLNEQRSQMARNKR